MVIVFVGLLALSTWTFCLIFTGALGASAGRVIVAGGATARAGILTGVNPALACPCGLNRNRGAWGHEGYPADGH